MKYRLEWRRGQPVISGTGVDYAGGQLKAAWEEAFLSYGLTGRGWERVLLIGMGASLMQILARSGKPPPHSTTVLEKDPEMIRLQEAYFELPLPYRSIIGDAAETVHTLSETFDGIFVDAFVEREVPDNLLSKDFLQALHQRLDKHGLLLWNVLLGRQAKRLEAMLGEIWSVVRVRRIDAHYFFLAAKASEAIQMPF